VYKITVYQNEVRNQSKMDWRPSHGQTDGGVNGYKESKKRKGWTKARKKDSKKVRNEDKQER
jgi:hypothetical protein